MNDEVLAEYFQQMAARGYSQMTIYWHNCYLKKCLAYLKRKGITDLKAVTSGEINAFLRYLKEEYRTAKGTPITNGSYRCHLNAVNSFFRWLEDTGQILTAPVAKRKEPGNFQPERLPNVINEEEAVKILESCPANTPNGLRNRAILELLYSTGIRRRELVNLNLSDFSPERRELAVIKGKGVKSRIVPVGEYATRFTEGYIKLIRPWMARENETALFVSSTTGKRLSLKSLDKFIQKIIRQSGITKRVTPHTFRHSMATHMLRSGADLRHIQAILGHASLSSTEIYTHLTREDLHRMLKKCHPHGKRAVKETGIDS